MSISCKILISVIIAALPVIAALLLIPKSVLAKTRGKIAMYLIFWGFMGNAAWISYQFQPADWGGWIAPLIIGVALTAYVAIRYR